MSQEVLAEGKVVVTFPPEDVAKGQVVIKECGRLVARHIIKQFQVGAWKHGVTLTVDKTTPGWFDTTVCIRFTWEGTLASTEAYKAAAKRYLLSIADN